MDSEEMDFKALVIAARARKTEGLNAPNAIPTEYKGVKFRSRLEAKWAIFFDTLGIEWEYEPQGYEIGTGYDAHWPRYLFSNGETLAFETRKSAEFHIKVVKQFEGIDITILDVLEPLGSLSPDLEWYLPDFWLPGLEVWVEVKGQFGWEELRTAVRATDGFSSTLPNVRLEDLKDPRNTVAGLLYLGNIPNPERGSIGSHVVLRNSKGTTPRTAKFVFNPVNNRVELKEEKGGPVRYWLSFDVYNCYSEESILSNYAEALPRLRKDIVNGAPREEKTREEKELEKWKFLGMDDATRAVVVQKTEEELFAEDVIKAGWAAARNYQFK